MFGIVKFLNRRKRSRVAKKNACVFVCFRDFVVCFVCFFRVFFVISSCVSCVFLGVNTRVES